MCIISSWFLPVESYSVSLFTERALHNERKLLCALHTNGRGPASGVNTATKFMNNWYALIKNSLKQCTLTDSCATVYEGPFVCFSTFWYSLPLYARMIQWCSSHQCFALCSRHLPQHKCRSGSYFYLAAVVFSNELLVGRIALLSNRPYVDYLHQTYLSLTVLEISRFYHELFSSKQSAAVMAALLIPHVHPCWVSAP